MSRGTGFKATYITAITDVDSTDIEGIGTLRWEGEKLYKYVRLQNETATVAGAAGDLCQYDAESGYKNNRVVTDLTDASTMPIGAGLLAGTVAGVAGTAYYCWIQIKGAGTLVEAIAASVDGTPVACADGDQIVNGAADKVARRVNTVIDADAEARAIIGIAVDASAKEIICNFPE